MKSILEKQQHAEFRKSLREKIENLEFFWVAAKATEFSCSTTLMGKVASDAGFTITTLRGKGFAFKQQFVQQAMEYLNDEY